MVTAVAGAADPPPAAPGEAPGQRIYRRFDDGTTLRLDLFPPERMSGDEPAAASPPCAAIVFFHGGGWQSGSPSQFHPHCRHLAAKGVFAISAEYRLGGRHGATPFQSVEDARFAMSWVRAHAGELGIDPERLAVGGGSAGGHLAAATAVLEGFDAPDVVASDRPTPCGLVLFNPVIDTTERGFGAGRLGDRARELSPVHHVDEDTPPAIVFHGTADTTVPFENVERFAREMKRHGNVCELVPYPGRKHGFFNPGRGEPGDYEDTLRRMDAFLETLGFGTGEHDGADAEADASADEGPGSPEDGGDR